MDVIDPARIFRECEARDIFGYSPTVLREKIKSGDIPAPVLLSPPPSRARGWYGWMINEHREKVAKQQEAWAAAVTSEPNADGKRYVPKGGNVRKAAPAAVTKLRLRPRVRRARANG